MLLASAEPTGLLVSLHACDTAAFLRLNALHSPAADGVVRFVSGPWLLALVHLVLLAAIVRWRDWRRSIVLLSLLTLVILVDLAGAHAIKELVQRPRPSWLPELESTIHLVDGRRGGAFGFVSTHTAYAFAIAAFAFLHVRRRSVVALVFVWALAVGYSRIYLGLHYPGDVLGGAAWGALVAFAATRLPAGARTWLAQSPRLPAGAPSSLGATPPALPHTATPAAPSVSA
ncbi:MAG TPA: phosphatase PAP2 family protein [Opitutaceae bacterium]|nr:phosphatase PAP2 family protein [Opitutaceae bacterium]